MYLDLISKYRTQLMGIAILWVMFFHSYLDVSAYPLLNIIKQTGYVGVDIFMFVSGFGIYYSLSKNSSLKTYYKNRILRILPYYIPIVAIYSLSLYSLNIWDIGTVIRNILTINFWVEKNIIKLYDWYIPSILAIYALSPLFYKLFKKNKNITSISVIIFFYALSLTGIHYKSHLDLFHIQLLILRIPTYIAGFWIADYIKNNPNTKLSTPKIVFAISALIIGTTTLTYLSLFHFTTYMTYSLFFMPIVVPPLCLLYCYIFSLLPKYRFPILTLCGTYSLTLFIFHERVRNSLVFLGIDEYMDFIAFAITFVLAITWTKLVDYVLAKILSKFAHSY